MSDKTIPLDFDTWWKIYDGLKGSPWGDDDIADANVWLDAGSPDARPAAGALKYGYDRAKEWEGPVDPEDGVAAVLHATYGFHDSNEWTPLQVGEMADHFAVFYEGMADPMQDWLDDHHGRIPLDWLTDRAHHEVSKGVQKESEVWVIEGEGPPGVWVFNKPGRTP